MSLLPAAYSTPSAVAQTYCVPWNPSDSLLSLYQETANQFNTDNDPTLDAIIQVALQNQMMLYRKANCTDCATAGIPATQTVINPPAGVQSLPPPGSVFNGASSAQMVGTGVALGTEGAELGATIAGAASTIPLIGSVASIVEGIISIFGAAHAQAVAEEQATNCAVALAFNKYIPAYDYAVYTGQLSAEAALADVTQIINQQLIPALSPVISGNNWGWGARQVLEAHLYFRQQWYTMLENNATVGLGSASAVLGGLESNPILLLAIAAAAAIFLL